MFFQIENVILYGTVQGAVFSLLALGFSLVFGVGGVLNLGHGAFYLITSWVFFWIVKILNVPLMFIQLFNMPDITITSITLPGVVIPNLTISVPIGIGIVISIIISVGISIAIGAAVYLALIKPLQDSHIGVVIVTFGFAFFLEQVVRILFGIKPNSIPVFIRGSISIFGMSFTLQFLFVIIGALILILIVTLFINYTTMGKSIRAVSLDREAAMLMGINADRVLMITIMISALLAGMAAVLYAPAGSITVDMGWNMLLSAFAVTVFGGLGSIRGSVIGAFVMGYAKTFCTIFINESLGTVFPLLIIVFMLLFRPQGLLGKKELR